MFDLSEAKKTLSTKQIAVEIQPPQVHIDYGSSWSTASIYEHRRHLHMRRSRGIPIRLKCELCWNETEGTSMVQSRAKYFGGPETLNGKATVLYFASTRNSVNRIRIAIAVPQEVQSGGKRCTQEYVFNVDFNL